MTLARACSITESSSPFSLTDFFSILKTFTRRTLTGPESGIGVKSETTMKAPQRCNEGESEPLHVKVVDLSYHVVESGALDLYHGITIILDDTRPYNDDGRGLLSI